MVAITNAVSLTFLKDELETTLNTAGARLEQIPEVNEEESRKIVSEAVATFHQVHGICRMLELPAAGMMAEEMELMAHEILEQSDPIIIISALGSAIVLLERYLEYIQIKDRQMPELIIDGLNELRRLAGKSAIPESHFFSVNLGCERFPDAKAANVSPNDKPRLIRRMRHMYQIGLLGVLREENARVNLKLVVRALDRMDRLCAPGEMSRLIWVARGAVTAMLHDRMVLSRERKALLGQYDRQLKQLVYDTATGEHTKIPLLLIKSSLYLVSLSTSHGGVLGEIKQVFDIRNALSDEELHQERAIMSGGSSVIHTVAEALTEELDGIKKALDVAAEGGVDADFGDIAQILQRIANTLQMVGSPKVESVRKLENVANKWQEKTIDPAGADFQKFVDHLLVVENAITILIKRVTPGQVHKQAHNDSISLHELDDARLAVVSESRTALSLAKRAVSNYADAHDPMHLANLPAVLAGAVGGMTFLELPRARAVLNSCCQYVEQNLLSRDAEPATDEQMETLADALTSIDYYLESMEERKPIGVAVLEIAELGLEELGFPVMRSA